MTATPRETLIFSDVHLRVTEPERTREFAAFLRAIDPARFDRVVCLGDLFDFWFEYRHVVFSDYFEVLRAFAELRDAGIELHLVCGNHDFWAGRFLRETLGFRIHLAGELWFGERRALLVHGDGLNPDDWKYRLYKRIARNPFVIWAFRQLHPDWAMALARLVSHGSRTLYKVEDPAGGPEAQSLRDFARAVLKRGDADIVLCGHAHAATIEEFPTLVGTGLYVNPGDWLEHRAFAVWDGETFRLRDGMP
ncbi:MAG TPA: UDP-2,3-diacylglucosamine diphosphatase [Candidatus Hydrogenedentes bacterium]|nr:UDP-2,3-diacylglucosamine diphosphatase [Candidatus Hydrogenedentota bacterium]